MTLRFQGYEAEGRRLLVAEGKGTSWLGLMRPFRKTVLTYAAQMPEAFEVETIEGTMTGKRGDWLAVGAHGEMYPIDAAVFAATYEAAEP